MIGPVTLGETSKLIFSRRLNSSRTWRMSELSKWSETIPGAEDSTPGWVEDGSTGKGSIEGDGGGGGAGSPGGGNATGGEGTDLCGRSVGPSCAARTTWASRGASAPRPAIRPRLSTVAQWNAAGERFNCLSFLDF